MSQDNRKEARSVLLRILEIGLAVGVTVGVVAFASKSLVSGVFTQDLLVTQEVQRVMPVVGLFMVSCLASEQDQILFCCQLIIVHVCITALLYLLVRHCFTITAVLCLTM